ncbi:calpain-2 catalytic subunit-like isoform X3 [Tachysurus fulvidraco]|uniref:calpain-2 catalytic subunit-like isoform X3 n=1 Tax=Tachysurus fulvidraco TaxID=1234273 RepID=UPI001FEEBCA9|nr:calpain-2 catalytic subunit-like isoform X3 [Tachysurus fulvidraco]
MSVSKYLNQDYEVLRSQCLWEKKLFCDPHFPAAPESLGFNKLGPNSEKTEGVEWKRPGDLCQKPQFIIAEATRADVCQGKLGDCWLMAAIADLTLDQDILARVIYPEQNFEDKYAGIFHFQLWQYGQWVDVVVDDKLPAIKGKLLFVKSKDQTEYWSALLEKAYAKVNGCYENLIGGFASEANEDFTGGIAEWYSLNKAPLNLFNIMEKALCRGSLLSTYISASNDEKEHKTAEHLVKKHVYSITAAQKVKVRKSDKVVELLRLRNPWGYMEWNGAWSDSSKEWDEVSPEDKAKLNYSANDGEFWMTYTDYIQRYSQLDICNLTPDTPSDGLRCWNACQFEGTWKIGTTAGGCLKLAATFYTNPQYRVKLDIDSHGDNKCSALVALMQKGARQAKHKGVKNYAIGFYIYKVPDKYKGKQGVCLGPEDLRRPVAQSEFVHMREVCQRFNLPLDEYVIIPATKESNKEANFLLRVFSEK